MTDLNWFRSSYSGGNHGESCEEIAVAPRAIHVRDSKHTEGPRLTSTSTAWSDVVSRHGRRTSA